MILDAHCNLHLHCLVSVHAFPLSLRLHDDELCLYSSPAILCKSCDREHFLCPSSTVPSDVKACNVADKTPHRGREGLVTRYQVSLPRQRFGRAVISLKQAKTIFISHNATDLTSIYVSVSPGVRRKRRSGFLALVDIMSGKLGTITPSKSSKSW